jgi:8-oxo-dGTP diphosphatase
MPGSLDVYVAAIIRRGDRLLLCHRHPDRAWYPNVWDLPGGHVERDELPRDALARELYEELGLVLPAPVNRPFETIYEETLSVELTIWLIDCSHEVVNRAPAEHDELRRVARHELQSMPLAHPSYVALLDRAYRS